MKKIVVIGDSHSTLYSNITERNRGVWKGKNLNVFDVRWIGPVTYWKLCRDQENFIDFDRDIIYSVLPECQMTTKVESGSDIIIVLGEIDVRCNILKFGYKEYKSTVDGMCEKLEEFLLKYNKNFKLHLQSIVPTIYRSNFGDKKPLFPFVGDDEQRKEVTLYFNKKLKEISRKLDIGYFDIFGIYADENNMMDLEKSDRIVHGMKTEELENYIKKYFDI